MSFQIVCIGTSKFYWLLPLFARQFKKWWPGEPLFFYGDKPVSCPGVIVRQCPLYPDWHWDRWFGDGLRNVLDDLNADILGLFLLDQFIAGPVSINGANDLATYMSQKGTIVRGSLAWDRVAAPHLAFYRSIEVVSAPVPRPLDPALWNRHLLRGAIEPAWSFDDAGAGIGSFVAKNPLLNSVGTASRLVPIAHVLTNSGSLDFSNLFDEDAAALSAMLPVGATLAMKGQPWM